MQSATALSAPSKVRRTCEVDAAGLRVVWSGIDAFDADGSVEVLRKTGSLGWVHVGSGRWNGSAIYDCDAVLGRDDDQSEAVYEVLDQALAAKLNAERSSIIKPAADAMRALEGKAVARVWSDRADLEWWEALWNEAAANRVAFRLHPVDARPPSGGRYARDWNPSVVTVVAAAWEAPGVLCVAIGRGRALRSRDVLGTPLVVLTDMCAPNEWSAHPVDQHAIISNYARRGVRKTEGVFSAWSGILDGGPA